MVENEKLYVVTCISNPMLYKSRYKLYREFEKYILQFDNVVLYTVELAFADHSFEITEETNPQHIQVRSDCLFWHKENLLNIGISKLPADAKYIAIVDADVQFLNPHWAQDTIHQLQHYDVVQMFESFLDLGPSNEVLSSSTSFIADWKDKEKNKIRDPRYVGRKGTTGLAWAFTREALNNIGGVLDWCIIGSGDWHMAYCFTGNAVEISQSWLSPGYKMLLQKYQDDCNKYIKGNVGFVKGTAVHYFHGKKSLRGYGWRWKVLQDHNFDPILDLKKDCQGVYIVNPEKTGLLRDLRDYFESRNEDDISLN